MKPQDFLDQLLPAALACQAAHGIPASFTLAQGALESSWGDSDLATKAKNLFGIKADKAWHGPTFDLKTGEVFNGKRVVVPASWRKYATWDEAINDRALYLADNPRYVKCWAEATGDGWARAVAAAGYATDPAYAAKLVATIHGRNLQRFDQVPA